MSPPDRDTPTADNGARIAKVIARAGLCSRREAERLIQDGLVKVNGRTLDSPAVIARDSDQIEVEGTRLPPPDRLRIWAYHKPRGLITSTKDPQGRRTVFDDLPANLPRVQTIGRLDFNSEGLLLLTNDGAMKRKLELPATGWKRRYRVRVHGLVQQAQLDMLAKGMSVEGIHYGPIEATLDHQGPTNAWLMMGLREGKNREIRRVCAALGLRVNRLIRVSYGPFRLDDLPPGQVKEIPARFLRDQLGPTAKHGTQKRKGQKK